MSTFRTSGVKLELDGRTWTMTQQSSLLPCLATSAPVNLVTIVSCDGVWLEFVDAVHCFVATCKCKEQVLFAKDGMGKGRVYDEAPRR